MSIINNVYLFHHHDHDGIVSGLFMLRWANRFIAASQHIYTYSVDYDVNLSEILSDHNVHSDDMVIFVDYSFKSKNNIEQLRKYSNVTKHVIWIDHHASSMDTIANKEYSWILDDVKGIIDTTYSASVLAYGYSIIKADIEDYKSIGHFDLRQMDKICVDNGMAFPYPNSVIECVDKWDRHDRSDKNLFDNTITNFHRGLVLSDHLHSPANTDMIDIIIISINKINLNGVSKLNSYASRILQNGRAITRYIDNDDRFQLQYSFEFTIDGYRCIALNRKGSSTMFMEKYNEYDIVCTFIFNGDIWKYSLFSGNGTNCRYIAEHFGGGGHNTACGFSTKELILHKDCNILIPQK